VPVKSKQQPTSAEFELEQIGKNLKNIRKLRGLTISEVAKMTSISNGMVSLIERGVSAPSLGTLIALSNSLGVSLGDLVQVSQKPSSISRVLADDFPKFSVEPGRSRKIIFEDLSRGITLSIDFLETKEANDYAPASHPGFEVVYVLEGKLSVEIGGEVIKMEAGERVAYASTTPHRANTLAKNGSTVLWLNIHEI
jgi:transcriptional regulator with XRE-family HTH domain